MQSTSTGDQTIISTSVAEKYGTVFILNHWPTKSTIAFKIHGPDPDKELFDRAREWYQLFDKDIDVKVLACQIRGSDCTRLLFNGNSKMVNCFLNEVHSAAASEGTVVIEVTCMK